MRNKLYKYLREIKHNRHGIKITKDGQVMYSIEHIQGNEYKLYDNELKDTFIFTPRIIGNVLLDEIVQKGYKIEIIML